MTNGKSMTAPGIRGAWAVLAVLLAFSAISNAASIRKIGTSELLTGSELVFEGRAINLWAEAGPVRGSIVTKVDFEIVDIVKGAYASSTITLQFMGGTLNGIRQVVQGMQVPALGERGIYFVESVERQLINPLYGWSQGHFIVQSTDGGPMRVYTNALQPVYDIAAAKAPANVETTHGHAAGIHTSPEQSANAPLTSSEFKEKLLAMMGGVQ